MMSREVSGLGDDLAQRFLEHPLLAESLPRRDEMAEVILESGEWYDALV
jgi:hypothetical protein